MLARLAVTGLDITCAWPAATAAAAAGCETRAATGTDSAREPDGEAAAARDVSDCADAPRCDAGEDDALSSGMSDASLLMPTCICNPLSVRPAAEAFDDARWCEVRCCVDEAAQQAFDRAGYQQSQRTLARRLLHVPFHSRIA